MRLFVTGATGFIGSHFVNRAHAAGHDLICLRRPGSNCRVPLGKQPRWLDGSLEDDWGDALTDCDAVVHLAAHSANVPYDTLANCLRWNLTAPLILFDRARDVGVTRFVVAGTGFEYGTSGERYESIPTDAPLLPTMTYPASKAAAAIAFGQWTIEHGVRLQYLRIFQVFGLGEAESRLWPSLKRAALAGEDFSLTAGEQIRDFTPVADVVETLLAAVERSDRVSEGKPEFRHVGTGKPQSLRSFVEYWWDHWGASGQLHFGAKPYRQNEVMRYVPEIEV